VREGFRHTKCQYCGTVDERVNLKTVAQVTPPTFRPPPRWTPPAHVPADSNLELHFKRRVRSGGGGGVVIAVVIVLMLAVIPTIFFLSKRGGTASRIGSPGGPELARLSLAQTAPALASSLSTKASDRSVYAPIDSNRFEYLTLSWKEGHPEAPESFYFSARKGVTLDAGVRSALESKLGRSLDENGSWRWEHVWLNVDLKTGSMGGNVDIEYSDKEPNPYWKRQLMALYQVVVAATFNQNIGPNKADAQELLGTGYALGDLTKLDPKTPIEAARDRVGKLFPGSVFSASSNLDAHVALTHPLFTHTEIEWKNEKASPVYEVAFRSRNGPQGYVARRDAVATCLSNGLRVQPEVHETDYMKKKKDIYITVKSVRIYVSETYLYFFVEKPLEAAEWSRLISTIDSCR
jgi:hypothetical protein